MEMTRGVKIKIAIADVRNLFLGVLSGAITRENADRWAYLIIQKNEADELEFSPPQDREKIWSGVMYLYGIDMRESPDEYLHTAQDIRTAMWQIQI